MVFTAIADITFEITIWGVKKAFNVGYWALWGYPKTETELLLERQNRTLELLHEDLMRINENLNTNENNIPNNQLEVIEEVKMIKNHLKKPMENGFELIEYSTQSSNELEIMTN